MATDRPGSAPPRLHRLGASCASHPVRALLAWVLLLVLTAAANSAAGGVFSDDVDLPHTQSHTGSDLLKAHQPAASGSSGSVVIHVDGGTVADHKPQVDQVVAALRALPHVLSASDPLAAGQPGATAVSTVQFDKRPKALGDGYLDQLHKATAPLTAAGVQVELGGGLNEITQPPQTDVLAEAVGFGVALVVLLIGFGSVLAALLPLVTALLGVGVGLGLLGLASASLTFGTASPTLALMIGIGVGIDYALFSTTRYRQLIKDGATPVEAAAATTASSGHAVLVAAGTVALALLGLYASGVAFIGQLGLAALFTVLVAAAAAVTLVPSLLTLAGRRIDALTVRTPVAEEGQEGDGWHRYSEAVARRPWWYVTAGAVVLVVLSIPLLSIRLGHVDDGASPTSYTSKRAYDLVREAYGPGANGTFTVVVDLAGAPPGSIATNLQRALAATPGVASASALTPSSDSAVLLGKVVPTTGPQDAATTALFDHLKDDVVPGVLKGSTAQGYLTGTTASQLEFRNTLASRLPLLVAVVLLAAFVLILCVFRSPLLALQSAVLNLLSIGAAYGTVVAVFQWGWGRSLLGVSEDVPIESYVPVLMFSIVFGLSMDYQVFLLSRVKEAYHRTDDSEGAVAEGLASTARVISCAALIMISVFTAFVASTSVVIKMLSVGLASSVLIDASIVRLLLVPSTMMLFGDRAWRIPARLDRLLPHIDAEGAPIKPVITDPHQVT